MTKDEELAMDLALEALELLTDTEQTYEALDLGDKAIAAIKQARSAPVQEPVAFNAGVPPLYPEMKDGETISVEYTTPPAAQRQWVGLTDDQIRGLTPKPDGVAEGNVRRVEVLPGVMGTEFDEVDAWSMPLVLKIARAIEAAHGITKGQP